MGRYLFGDFFYSNQNISLRSYTKTNVPAYQELQINNENPWEFAECVYTDFMGIIRDVDELWSELSLLQKRIAEMKCVHWTKEKAKTKRAGT